MNPHFFRRAPLFLMAVAVAGCAAKEKRVPVFPVKGTVLVGGKAAEKAQVIFHPVGEADPKVPRPTGEVAADGTFSLSTYTANDGAPAGDYTVTVTWPEGISPIGGDADTGGDRLGGRYSNPKTTALRARVNEAATDLPPFKLN
jgi:hypothetical protein